jgi:hypothetical protein
MRYAEHTTVPVEKTRAELERLLRNHNAGQFAFFNDIEHGAAIVVFRLAERNVKLRISLPTLAELEAQIRKKPPRGWHGWYQNKRNEWLVAELAQLERQRWRSLLLVTKAKLELIADGSSTVEREFLPDILLPNGTTVGEALSPQIAAAYESGQMPPLLPEWSGA